MPKVFYKPIPGFSNYEIGRDGKVKRLQHVTNGKHRVVNREMYILPNRGGRGSSFVTLIDDNGKRTSKSIRRLMLEAFADPNETYYMLTDDPMDNRWEMFMPLHSLEFRQRQGNAPEVFGKPMKK